MWTKLKAIVLSVLFVFSSAPGLYSQSARDTTIQSLDNYIQTLTTVKKSIGDYKAIIEDCKIRIDNLSKQLADSQEILGTLGNQLTSSEDKCNQLASQLAESRKLLEDSQKALAEQEQNYKRLLGDLWKLGTSYTISRGANWILGAGVVLLGGYVGGHVAGWWK